jgi:UDP-GlcNAc:undecaprenyl-phosphate GlcNAc-1-phosphate transferase
VVIKGKFRTLREKGIFIRVCFKVLEIGLPLLLLLTCLIPAAIPSYPALGSAVFCVLVLLSLILKERWTGGVLRLSLYLSIPFLIHLTEVNTAGWISRDVVRLYNLSFAVVALFVVLTLKFTRRRKGFKVTPMDFLILFIGIVVPNLPYGTIGEYPLGTIAAKVIMLFFSYEVLMGELRGQFKGLGLATMAALATVGIRGLM